MNYHKNLEEIVHTASQALRAIPEDEMSFKSTPEKWSRKEILGHLIDSAVNNYRRMLLAQLKDDLLFDGYDQNNWVRLNHYHSRSATEIIDTWKAINLHIVHLVSNIPHNKLTKKTSQHHFDKMSMIPLQQGKESDLGYLIWDYIYHIEHHLKQIIEGYASILEPYEG